MVGTVKILLLTFYYPPDLSAGSFRAKSLVEALHRQPGSDLNIDVITTSPNRYHTYKERAEFREQWPNLTITRLPLPSHRSGFMDQSRVFLSFARQVIAETHAKQWDIVIATSSRLMTAALGAQVARRSGSRLYLDIRDLFTDTMSDLLSDSVFRHTLPAFRMVERHTFRAAGRVNLVSAGFAAHGIDVAPDQSFRFFTNGIDDEFLNRDFSNGRSCSRLPLTILYAGNIGDGQGLHRIVPEAARRMGDRARIKLIGAGGRRRALERTLAREDAGNFELSNPIPRARLCDEYRAADILFLHLNDHDAFKKVLPSKIFEYAATGKRILAGVAGHAADFLRREVDGCAVFTPCNADEMMAGLERLLQMPEIINRDSFKSRFARTTIMDKMAGDIVAFATVQA
jgi:glycosyltransferase involved in cell wall biosynthesis